MPCPNRDTNCHWKQMKSCKEATKWFLSTITIAKPTTLAYTVFRYIYFFFYQSLPNYKYISQYLYACAAFVVSVCLAWMLILFLKIIFFILFYMSLMYCEINEIEKKPTQTFLKTTLLLANLSKIQGVKYQL